MNKSLLQVDRCIFTNIIPLESPQIWLQVIAYKIEIQNASFVSKTPSGGIYAFVRRVDPNQTLTKHDSQGMYIIPPGSSFALFFLSPGKNHVQARVHFGWWEEKSV